MIKKLFLSLLLLLGALTLIPATSLADDEVGPTVAVEEDSEASIPKYDTYKLPVGKTAGIAIGYSGWAPNAVKLPNPKTNGFAGLVIQGEGVDQSFIEMDDWGASIIVGVDCGNIIVRDCTIVGARDMGIKAGSKKGDWITALDPNGNPIPGADPVWKSIEKNLYPDSRITLVDVKLALGKHNSKWFVDSSNYDHFWINVEVDASCARLGEHLLYAHGVANKGIYFKKVRVYGTGAEIVKVCTREWEAHYAPQAVGIFELCYFRNFGARWGGSAFSMQGSGLQRIVINRCVVEGRTNGSSQPIDRMLGLSDGLSSRQNAENNQRRAYDVNTGLKAGDAPPGWCSNGDVVVKDSAFLGFGGHPEMETYSGYLNYNSLGIEFHFMARSFTMTNSVMLDGDGSANGISNIKFNHVADNDINIRGNNDPYFLKIISNQFGWPVTHETFISFPGIKTQPLSQVTY